MGITIHYELVVDSSDSAIAVLEAAKEFALQQSWDVEAVDIENGQKTYMIDEVEEAYVGPLIGVVLRPHEDCDPLSIVFGTHGIAQDYCKTQFAPVDVHIAIIDLFKRLVRNCDSLSVRDEGGYLSTGDRDALVQRMTEYANAIQLICEERGCDMKYVTPSGRILDAYGDNHIVEVKL